MKKAAYLAAAGLFAMGFPLHFAYEWSGGLALIGTVCPVNESVWEHLKLAFFPLVIWWLIYGWRTNLLFKHFTIAAATSAGAACMAILMIHYTVSGALGAEMIAADIAALAAGLFIGQYLALGMLDRPHGNLAWSISGAALIVLTFMMIFFTFSPPHFPVFLDAEGGYYGIQR